MNEEFQNIQAILSKIAKHEKLTKLEIQEYERYRERIFENYKYRRRNPH